MGSQDKNKQIIIYNTEDGETKIEVMRLVYISLANVNKIA